MNPRIELTSHGHGCWVLLYGPDCLGGISQCATDLAAQKWATETLAIQGVHVTMWAPIPGTIASSYAADEAAELDALLTQPREDSIPATSARRGLRARLRALLTRRTT